ncbi:MAG TPA: HipA domain-containing protein [Paraburkholderia sp.]|uniref:type II toxin-antitoxin system HipA family toxin n=1 Tax=Paraburkholderia sp. TaxID=1926495 RepID=UPI002B47D93C|nr:HipA domain-containing protein [Paraburkholderia sp.]HKR41919.1 HipA domain-containing protein [Paraburkholderia sp.]
MSTVTREVYVFAHLGGAQSGRFAPAGRLSLLESAGSPPQASEFAYGTRYLENPNAFEIDPVSLSLADRLSRKHTVLAPANGLPEFGGIRDSAPDAWGRRVIEARLRKPVNSLRESDYLLEAGSDRVGALDVRQSLDSPTSRPASEKRSLEYILEAAERIEAGEPVPANLMDMLGGVPSAGGARPKASIRDIDDSLWLAKFPARNDAFNVAKAEQCTLEIARLAGLTVPAIQYMEIGNRPVMLIRRFDRYWLTGNALPSLEQRLHDTLPTRDAEEHRLPFISGLTLLGCPEMDSPLKGYSDLAGAMRQHLSTTQIAADCEELFARMVFNIFTSNDDDHLRNHGFVLDPRLAQLSASAGIAQSGWRLSPLYDVVPRPGISHERTLHLQIGAQGKVATLDNALTHFAAFMPDRATALAIVRRVWGEVRQWKTVFDAMGADGILIDQVTSAFRKLEDIASPELIKRIRETAAH